ncbi:MAG: hypothetical protein ACM3SR_15380 [Ignavibacteriales bacterium]
MNCIPIHVEFMDDTIASLCLRFSNPGGLEELAFGIRAGVAFLRTGGIDAALTWYSFGSAAVIRAAATSPPYV